MLKVLNQDLRWSHPTCNAKLEKVVSEWWKPSQGDRTPPKTKWSEKNISNPIPSLNFSEQKKFGSILSRSEFSGIFVSAVKKNIDWLLFFDFPEPIWRCFKKRQGFFAGRLGVQTCVFFFRGTVRGFRENDLENLRFWLLLLLLLLFCLFCWFGGEGEDVETCGYWLEAFHS